MFTNSLFKDPASQVNPSGPPFLPGPLVATGAHIKCSARPTKQFERDFEVSNKSLSAAVQMGQAMVKGSPLSKSKSEMRQRRNADAFLLNATQQGTATVPKPPGTKNMTKSTGAAAFFQAGTPLISIGPHSDAVLDRFGLDDHILPKLHQLIGSVRSSRWEAMLQSPKWNLTHEQASNLSKALNSDVHGNRAMPTDTKVFYISTVI
jgi:hypothetical protein